MVNNISYFTIVVKLNGGKLDLSSKNGFVLTLDDEYDCDENIGINKR